MSDIIVGDLGFDAITMLSVLTPGYYSTTILAAEAELPISRASAALRYLVNIGKASRSIEGYALACK